MRGKFITFEGIDGAGKSTHVEPFAQRLRDRGFEVEVTREPGGTALGEHIRDLLLGQPMLPATELLMAFAARNEHLHARIAPALAAGRWVVCDRFTDSTYAYQGGGRGLDIDWIADLERRVQGGLRPDLTLLFDLPADEAARRRARARSADRFEAEDLDFFAAVRSAYLDRVRLAPERYRVVDGRRAVSDISKELDILSLNV